MRNNKTSNFNFKNKIFNNYLVLGSIVTFLFVLVPISLIYLTDYNLILIFVILGPLVLVYFLIRVLKLFNDLNKNTLETLTEIESKNPVKFRHHISDEKMGVDYSLNKVSKNNRKYHRKDDNYYMNDKKIYNINDIY